MRHRVEKNNSSPSIRLGDLAEHLQAKLIGDADTVISGIAALNTARSGQLSFLASSEYQQFLQATDASAVILTEQNVALCPCAALISSHPYMDYAKSSRLFARSPKNGPGIHPTAQISADAKVSPEAEIRAYAVVEGGAQIAPGAVIGEHCVIGSDSSVGANSILYPRVTLYSDCSVGEGCIIHSGVVLGSDGFGFAITSEGEHEKIAQLGGVQIGDCVEIGANCTIDRGALEDTRLDEGVKLDSGVHIGHGSHIGAHTLIAGAATLAGSVRVGKRCRIGGLASIVPGAFIVDGVEIAPTTLVTSNITADDVAAKGSYFAGGATGHTDRSTWRRNAAAFRNLARMARTLEKLAPKQDRKK